MPHLLVKQSVSAVPREAQGHKPISELTFTLLTIHCPLHPQCPARHKGEHRADCVNVEHMHDFAKETLLTVNLRLQSTRRTFVCSGSSLCPLIPSHFSAFSAQKASKLFFTNQQSFQCALCIHFTSLLCVSVLFFSAASPAISQCFAYVKAAGTRQCR